MPELPDITAYVEALEERVIDRPLEGVRVASPFVVRSFDPPLRALEGHAVRGLRRLGKRIVFELEGELFLVIHLMVAGRLRYEAPGKAIPKKVGLAAFDFPDATLVFTEASKKKRASIHAVRGEAGLASLDPGGMEVLGCALDDFRGALLRENHTLKRTLTDPHVFSGIGNAYSDEILHRAKLSPVKWTQRLSDDEIGRLHEATQTILVEWIERLRAERAGGFPEKVTAFRPEMAVHGKYKTPCPVCGGKVMRIVRGESEINYCPTCQTDGKLLADRALSRLLHGDWPRTLEELDERKARLAEPEAKRTSPKEVATKTQTSATTTAKTTTPAKAKTTATSKAKPIPKQKGPATAASVPVAKTASGGAASTTSAPRSPRVRRANAAPLIVLAPGAGAPSTSPWMEAWAQRLGAVGRVVTFDYPYMAAGRKRPDRQDTLVAAHLSAVAAAAKDHRDPLVLVGKSMGGRIGCHASLERPVDLLVCLGYPLVSPGKKKTLRDEILLALRVPILFVQGTRDPLCPLDELARVRARMAAPNELHVVDSADHSLVATKTWLREHGETQEAVDARTAVAIAAFVAAYATRR
jgi:formamidopyrimidine-DNA glycosylase